jgi:hypothetical protein
MATVLLVDFCLIIACHISVLSVLPPTTFTLITTTTYKIILASFDVLELLSLTPSQIGYSKGSIGKFCSHLLTAAATMRRLDLISLRTSLCTPSTPRSSRFSIPSSNCEVSKSELLRINLYHHLTLWREGDLWQF